MSIPQALRTSRTFRRVSQADINVPLSRQMKSAIECGDRKIPRDIAPKLAEQLDHPALYAELARELTGFGPTWLDGPNVDLHRAAVREKALEELREAMHWMDKFPAHAPPDVMTEGDRKARYAHLMQAMDAMVALYHYVGVQCLEYRYSMLQLSRDHHNKMRGKRYATT